MCWVKDSDIMAWYDPYMPSQAAGYGAVPKTEVLLSPQEYLALTERVRANCRQVRIIPPRLGEPGFGHFLLITRTPIYEVEKPLVHLPRFGKKE